MFTDDLWNELVSTIGSAFQLSATEINTLKNGKIAKLIGAIPYIANCQHPDRVALNHLSTYWLALKDGKEVFLAKPSDSTDVFARLATISDFPGGNAELYNRGMALLALNMMHDYERDKETDKAQGKYNPIAQSDMDFETERAKLIASIQRVKSEEMDAILDVDAAAASFWNG